MLITFDTLRYDAFDRGAEVAWMPELRAFAARGLSFERFYATTPITQPTHASLFTGLHPWAHGVRRNGIVLEDEHTTIAEYLRTQGYSTHAVVASFPVHEVFGFAQGFDTYDDDFDHPYMKAWGGQQTEDGKFFSLSASVTERAIAAIDRARGDKQFFWVHYFDPHDPYGDTGLRVVSMKRLTALIGEPGLAGELRAAHKAYGRDVRSMDESMAGLLQRLDEQSTSYQTHIILTADHGESFGELGSLGHGKRLSPEQVHVPLLIVSPYVEPGVRTDLASSVDLPRTITALAGLEGPFAGRDLAAASTAGAGVVGMRTAFDDARLEHLTDGTTRSLRGAWFFTVIDDLLVAGNSTAVLEEDDPARPADATRSAEARRVFSGLERLLDRRDPGAEVLDPDVQRALRALGYTR